MVENLFIKGAPAKLIKTIDKDKLIKRYQEIYHYDVSPLFKGADSIQIYECQESGYRFYYPHNLMGDSAFYEMLQRYEWYYTPWKWEHEYTDKLINEGDRILEVGCGQAGFIQEICKRHHSIHCMGLELNKDAVKKGERFEVINGFIEDFAENNAEQFDLVCSFQVLEHISSVYSFLKAKAACVKKGGRMIKCVPNNESFIKWDNFSLLNMPPHHMGLWSEQALKKIAQIFDLECEEVVLEPLQEHHFDYYLDLKNQQQWGEKMGTIKNKVDKILKVRPSKKNKLAQNKGDIHGHSILISLRKKA